MATSDQEGKTFPISRLFDRKLHDVIVGKDKENVAHVTFTLRATDEVLLCISATDLEDMYQRYLNLLYKDQPRNTKGFH